MRHPADDLAGRLTTAINAAFHDFRARARTSDAVDPALLAERFADFHD